MALDEAKFAEENFDKTPDKTWVTSFNQDGVSYATNMFWQSLQNVDDPFSDVEQAAQNVLEGANLFCIKKGKAPQFGLCVAQEGFYKGQQVAAAMLSGAMPNVSSFVAVFKVDAGWWYVCVRNDIILSDGDMLFVNEEDAKAQFESMLAVPDWNKKIAPKEWGIEGSEQLDLGELLAQAHAVKLQKVGSLRGGKLIAVFAVAGVLGIWILFSLIDAILFSTPKPRIVNVAPKKVEQPVVKQRIVEVKPWEKLPIVENVLENCYGAMKGYVVTMPPGWNMKNVVCNASGAKTSWVMSVGRLQWMKQALEKDASKFSSVSFAANGKGVEVATKFEDVGTAASAPTKGEAELIFELNDMFQSMGIAITIGKQTFTSQNNFLYKMVTFNFSSVRNPLAWEQILTKFSGLFINNIVYNPDTKIWQYEGAIYVL